jgi:hypothetical protein
LDKCLARLAERFGWLTKHRRQLNHRSHASRGNADPNAPRPSETRLTWFEAPHHQSQQAGVGYAMRTGGCYGDNCQKVRGAYPTGLRSKHYSILHLSNIGIIIAIFPLNTIG